MVLENARARCWNSEKKPSEQHVTKFTLVILVGDQLLFETSVFKLQVFEQRLFLITTNFNIHCSQTPQPPTVACKMEAQSE